MSSWELNFRTGIDKGPDSKATIFGFVGQTIRDDSPALPWGVGMELTGLIKLCGYQDVNSLSFSMG